MEKECFKGQHTMSIILVICTMIYINIIFPDSVPYALKVALGVGQIGINVYLLYESCIHKVRKLILTFGWALALNVLLTGFSLYYVYQQ